MNPALLAILGARAAAATTSGVTYRGYAVDTSDLTRYTLSGVNVGPADATRVVIITVNARNFAPTSVTIGGVTATLDISASATWIYRAAVPTGEGIAIQLESSTTSLGVVVGVWTIVGYGVSVSGAKATSSPNGNVTLAATSGGVAIAAAYVATASGAASWTGANEAYDVYSSGAGITASAAVAYPTTQGSLNIYPGSSIRLAAVAYTLT